MAPHTGHRGHWGLGGHWGRIGFASIAFTASVQGATADF
jgi:hypothetical protein